MMSALHLVCARFQNVMQTYVFRSYKAKIFQWRIKTLSIPHPPRILRNSEIAQFLEVFQKFGPAGQQINLFYVIILCYSNSDDIFRYLQYWGFLRLNCRVTMWSDLEREGRLVLSRSILSCAFSLLSSLSRPFNSKRVLQIGGRTFWANLILKQEEKY